MHIVFMGTPDFAAVSLEKLLGAGYPVDAVFSQPDRPVGRHQELRPTPVKKTALEHGIPVYQPQRIRTEDNVELLKKLAPDVIVVVAFGQILPQAILDIPTYGCVNVHGSLLPAYRGAAPIQRAILDGRKVTGITTMRLDAGMDTGDILLQKELPIGPSDTSGSLFEKLAVLGAEVLLETLPRLEEGSLTPVPQDENKATYAAMLKKEEGLLDFTLPASRLDCQIRAMNPWPSAYAFLQGRRVKILQAVCVEETGRPGELLPGKEAVVACGENALKLLLVQPEGKKPQSGEAFRNGLQNHGVLCFNQE